MPLTIHDESGKNLVNLPTETAPMLNGEVRFNGKGSSLSIREGSSAHALSITMGDGCHVSIGKGCVLGALEIFIQRDCRVSVGDGCGFNWRTTLHCHEPYDILIGDDCNFASGTMLTVSDIHSLVDVESGRLLNPGGRVIVGRGVCLGQDVAVLKGVEIGEGSVVGLRSIVTRSIPPQSLAVGSPARVIKTGVTWDFRTPSDYFEARYARPITPLD